MADTAYKMIERGDEKALRAWLLAGGAAAAPEAEAAGWARQAALLGRCGVLRTLCEACHAMSYIPDEQGRTLLHYAACSGDAETMAFTTRVLGYDAAQGDCAGVTPLDLAKERGEDALRALEEISGIRLADCYRNPVRRGFWPDPSILRVGEEYWMVNSTFAMVPALPISRSRDLVHWETVGHVFTDPDTAALSGLPGGYGYWAPDISYYQGRFWVVATLRRDTVPFRLQMITSASSPQGPWDAPRFLPVDGIDPSLFTDDDGKRYLVVNPGVQIARISDAGELLEQPRMIFLGWNKHKSEGPHILKKDGWYYIFQAEGGTGQHHLITCSRARSLEGPYESCPFNPILGPRQADAYIGRGGHGKPVALGDGRWAIPYLCGRKTEGKTLTGRETALDPLEWTADGWPMVNGLRGPSCLQRKPLPDHPVRESSPWMCPRADHRLFAAFEDGAIRLAGGQSPASLRDAHLLLHRQREAGVRQRVIADVSAMAIGGMAGLAGYYDENSWYLLGLRRTEKGAEIVLWERVGAEDRERPLGVVSGFRATLEIEGEGLTRRAACAESGERAAFRVEYLTDEGLRMGKRFTGATLGLAAVGAGQALLLDYFEEMTP